MNFREYLEIAAQVPKNQWSRHYQRSDNLCLTHAQRYWRVVSYLQENITHGCRVVDVGGYPGAFAQLCKYVLSSMEPRYTISGIGLGKDFKEWAESCEIEVSDWDINPSFPSTLIATDNNQQPFINNQADIILAMDVLEHSSCIYESLDTINLGLKKEGLLIITTDNITAVGYIIGMLLSGKSPNVHPKESSLYFVGSWRPHFREYSKEELLFFANYSGFELVSHEYFSREIGTFNPEFKQENGLWFQLKKSIKRLMFATIPHLRDHHIMILRKKNDLSDVSKVRLEPTTTLSDWHKLRNINNV